MAMTGDQVRELFRFNTWANRRLFHFAATLSPDDYRKDLRSSFGGVHGTLAHIVGAERLWLHRWLGSPATLLGPADFAALEDVVRTWDEVEAERAAFLAGLDDARLDDPVNVKASKGGAYVHSLRETLLHAVEHSSYHRGQVITLVRQLGHTPPAPSFNLMGFYRTEARRAG
jgi:uncharacterized damage-inducible protein DinB